MQKRRLPQQQREKDNSKFSLFSSSARKKGFYISELLHFMTEECFTTRRKVEET